MGGSGEELSDNSRTDRKTPTINTESGKELNTTPVNRRAYLAVLGAVGFGGLAGCSDDSRLDDPVDGNDGSTNEGGNENGTDERDGGNDGSTDTDDDENGTDDNKRNIENFPMFQYDPANTGYIPNAAGPSGPVTEQWRFDTGDWVLSQPTVVGDTVYVISWDDYLYAIDSRDGTEQWTFQLEGQVGSTTAIVDDTLIAGGGRDKLWAIDRANGTEKWTFEKENSSLRFVVANSTVYVGVGNSLHALDLIDGTEQWRFETTGLVGYPAVRNETVYTGSTSVEYDDDNNIIDSNCILHAADSETGTEQWTLETAPIYFQTPTVVDDTVYVSGIPVESEGSGHPGILYAVNSVDGTERWRFEADNLWISRSSAVAEGTVYVGSGFMRTDDEGNIENSDGTLYALDAENGTEQWTFDNADHIVNTPVVAGETIYVGSSDNHLYAIDMLDGTERWRFETGHVVITPAVVDDSLYVGSRDGNLYALTEA